LPLPDLLCLLLLLPLPLSADLLVSLHNFIVKCILQTRTAAAAAAAATATAGVLSTIPVAAQWLVSQMSPCQETHKHPPPTV
jgi:hypothetical protein